MNRLQSILLFAALLSAALSLASLHARVTHIENQCRLYEVAETRGAGP